MSTPKKHAYRLSITAFNSTRSSIEFRLLPQLLLLLLKKLLNFEILFDSSLIKSQNFKYFSVASKLQVFNEEVSQSLVMLLS